MMTILSQKGRTPLLSSSPVYVDAVNEMKNAGIPIPDRGSVRDILDRKGYLDYFTQSYGAVHLAYWIDILDELLHYNPTKRILRHRLDVLERLYHGFKLAHRFPLAQEPGPINTSSKCTPAWIRAYVEGENTSPKGVVEGVAHYYLSQIWRRLVSYYPTVYIDSKSIEIDDLKLWNAYRFAGHQAARVAIALIVFVEEFLHVKRRGVLWTDKAHRLLDAKAKSMMKKPKNLINIQRDLLNSIEFRALNPHTDTCFVSA